jgi:hypothetical protein
MIIDWFTRELLEGEGVVCLIVGDRATQNKKILALNTRSSLQGGGNRSRTSLIKLAREFIDKEVDVVTSRFSQLTSVSRDKMYFPPSGLMI